MGERLAGFIYGTIVTLSVVVAGGRAYPHESGHIALLALVTCVVFWVAHVYAQGLGHAVGHGTRLDVRELATIARHEASLIEASLPPIAALMLGSLGVISNHAAVWTALVLGLAVLGVQGIAYARIEHLGWWRTLAVFSLNLALGLVIIGLKLLVTH